MEPMQIVSMMDPAMVPPEQLENMRKILCMEPFRHKNPVVELAEARRRWKVAEELFDFLESRLGSQFGTPVDRYCNMMQTAVEVLEWTAGYDQ